MSDPATAPAGDLTGPPDPPAGEPSAGRGGAFLRWRLERLRNPPPPDPPAGSFPVVPHRAAQPRAPGDELRVTWVGQATALVQVGGLNVLTDPVWSRRASPVPWAGPARLTPPGIAFDELPPIDLVVLSHDHYDHLDDATVRRLHARHGDRLTWATPVGYRRWLARRGVAAVVELPWWERAELVLRGRRIELGALPARHWSRRGLLPQHRLWASWTLAAAGRRVYFGGDSGYFGGFAEIGRRAGPFDALLLPIGAYEPRWFMASAHMNPEDACRAWRDLGGAGQLIGTHWGTFRLTDEDPREPPVRMRALWEAAALPPEHLRILAHGETAVVPPLRRA